MDAFRSHRRWWSAALALSLLLPCTVVPREARAQRTASAGVIGTVTSTDGSPIGGAAVTLQGPASQDTVTDAQGRFTFAAVTPGVYTLIVRKTGFATTQEEDVIVIAGSPVIVSESLAPSSFSSLRQIGRVTTNVPGRATINTTPASIAVVSGQTFADQGQVQVAKVLNETPGIITTSQSANGASLGSPQVTQIRGALPYETESLIDGHPVSVGIDGSYSPIYLNPALLQNVEIAKGPGAMPTQINYAVNGAVNYRTLEPTRKPQGTVEFGADGFGGVFSSFQATGSSFGQHVDYAFALATNGTPSGLKNYPVASSAIPLLYGGQPWTLNGQLVAQVPPIGFAASNVPQFYGTPGAARYAQPIYVCCDLANAGYNSKAELAKLRVNFSQQTAITLSYLGGQATYDSPIQEASLSNIGGTSANFSSFAPPPGYSGAVPAGMSIPFDTQAFSRLRSFGQQNLLQAELRTSFGEANGLLARYYSGFSNQLDTNGSNGGTVSFGGTVYGGVSLCPAGQTLTSDGKGCGATASSAGVMPAPTIFNGTPGVFTSQAMVTSTLSQDHFRGFSFELNHTAGRNLYSVSVDRSQHDSYVYQNSPLTGQVNYTLSPGSSQQFTTVSLRGQFALAANLNASLSDYLIQYGSHYQAFDPVQNVATWRDATQTSNEPRLALAWRPSTDTAVRFSAGGSIAPPYISLLSSPGGLPVPDATGAATKYLLNQNTGDIKPETAFSFDLGIDKRFAGATSVSADVYLTTLHNLFLLSTYQNGAYTPVAPSADAGNTQPLYITQQRNLGQARYEGIELALQRTPLFGLGYRMQGSLQRAFTFSLPAGFYNASGGAYTQNLGIVPNVNFAGDNNGNSGFYGGLAGGRVPYGQGYGELNYRTRGGSYYNLGLTYFGGNNSYNQPAFAVFSGTARFTLARDVTLTISGDNLLGAYNQPFASYFGGVPVPLANGIFGGATTGALGTTRGGNYGPSVLRAALRYRFGGQ